MIKNLTSIVILSYNQVDFTRNCLESIRKYTNVSYEIIVIDNNSMQETVDYLETQTDIRLVKNGINVGFADGCNQGIKIANGEYILLLNNDTLVTKDYLINMLAVLHKEHNVAIVGPYTNNTIGIQKLDVELNYEYKENIANYGLEFSDKPYKPVLTPRLIGFCMLFRTSFMKDIGMFDEAYKIGNYEDEDLCIRTLLAGYKMFVCNNSFVYHYKRATFDKNKMDFEGITARNKIVIEEKWNNINWNYYVVNNGYLLNRMNSIRPKNILHLGCGVGALAATLKQNFDCNYVSTERHEIRKEIASKFADCVIQTKRREDLEQIPQNQYDVIIIEDMVEYFGIGIMEYVKRFIGRNTTIFLRVFNKYHISSYISLLHKKTWRNTICASSDEFHYSYGDVTDKLTSDYRYQVIECIEIKKILHQEEIELSSILEKYDDFNRESEIYSRLYELRNDC